MEKFWNFAFKCDLQDELDEWEATDSSQGKLKFVIFISSIAF